VTEATNGVKVIIIPDQHAHPLFDNDRFDWLGRLILDLKPDEVWNLGDAADLPSLSSYDKGKRSMENRRYKADVESSIEAQTRLWAPVNKYNEQQRSNRKAQYKPYKVMVMGNHSDRINRATQMDPALHGTISTEDLKFHEFYDEVVSFKEKAIRHGFAISHYFPSGIKGQAIGGMHAAYNLITKNGMSSVAGHSHLWDMKILTRADGQKMLGIVAGCYVHPDMIEGWNRDTQHMWDLSVTILEGVKNGNAEVVTRISQSEIKKRYG
jgi:hypothetical protein